MAQLIGVKCKKSEDGQEKETFKTINNSNTQRKSTLKFGVSSSF